MILFHSNNSKYSNLSPLISHNIRSLLEQSESAYAIDEALVNAAVSLVFYADENNTGSWQDLELLFMQRAVHPKDPWSGHIAFPGGGLESCDEHTLATAIRETHEELGFKLDKTVWCGALPPITGPVISDIKKVQVFPHIFVVEKKPEIVINEEVQSAFWLPVNRLSQQQFVFRYPHPKMQDPTMLAIDIGEHVNMPLWGLSLEILYQFYLAANWQVEQELRTFIR